jgi:hypothetical protein
VRCELAVSNGIGTLLKYEIGDQGVALGQVGVVVMNENPLRLLSACQLKQCMDMMIDSVYYLQSFRILQFLATGMHPEDDSEWLRPLEVLNGRTAADVLVKDLSKLKDLIHKCKPIYPFCWDFSMKRAMERQFDLKNPNRARKYLDYMRANPNFTVRAALGESLSGLDKYCKVDPAMNVLDPKTDDGISIEQPIRSTILPREVGAKLANSNFKVRLDPFKDTLE